MTSLIELIIELALNPDVQIGKKNYTTQDLAIINLPKKNMCIAKTIAK